ncbi:putative tyrosine-protein kinase Wsck [Ctenocephalides felis]|uniref:putative tyrosine-protein kinase Wsck n=1 Tax=Ctenocephalides felis TaxID=7515 RepID=UPI000E6E487F|nr:putative tyrosine-protein kinase Wsck [Ctenocephalides felis]
MTQMLVPVLICLFVMDISFGQDLEGGIGPPELLTVHNATETKMKLSWRSPRKSVPITGYTVTASALKSNSEYPLEPISWTYSNKTFTTELLNLHPGTIYNISVRADFHQMEGESTYTQAETLIGEPEPSPLPPTVISNLNNQIVIKIHPAVNYNGPVSAYRVIVSDESQMIGFDAELLQPYKAAKIDDLSYYIAAELKPHDINKDFIVGDGSTYNGYYNAPLDKSDTSDYRISVGLVSTYKGVTRIRYSSTPHAKIIFNIPEADNDKQSLIMGLTAAIVVFGILLVLSVLLYIVLRRRLPQRRRRDQQELALRGPIVEVENNGYIPEDEPDSPIDHHSRLRNQVWNIPRNFLNYNQSSVIGYGRFGNVVSGSLRRDGEEVNVAVQCIDVFNPSFIPDGELDQSNKRSMLRDLDLLIRLGSHTNIDSLIGICETPDHLAVVLYHHLLTLKDALLLSRNKNTKNQTFCNYKESQVLQFAVDVAWGMEYLTSKSIYHKQLCCRNIKLSGNGVAKVSGFGLADCRANQNSKPDYRRWTAQEVLRSQRYSEKSDIWSFGCVLWECCALGGTPYANIESADIVNKVSRGLRPPQLVYMNDELYQHALNCWQLDPDERPTFSQIAQELESLLIIPHFSFMLYEGFEYEPYLSELEAVKD